MLIKLTVLHLTAFSYTITKE